MAVTIKIEIENLDKLRSNFAKAPSLTLKYLSQAVAASIFEIEKQAVDPNFKFKLPRSMRSGFLQKSFQYGKEVKGLYGKIGPTASYAPYVYFGTRSIRPNLFMDRIANASESSINKHFNKAVDLLTDDLIRV